MSGETAGGSSSRQRIGPALAVVAAALLAAAIPATGWWQADAGEGAEAAELSYSFGLSQAEICRGDECHGRALSQLGMEPTWGKTAVAALGSLIMSAVLLLVLAGTYRGAGWQRHLGWVTAVMILFAAVLIFVVHLGQPFDGVRPGWPLIVGFLGLALGLSAAGLRMSGSVGSSAESSAAE